MIDSLFNIAYNYFPKGINSVDQPGLYYESNEIQLLTKVFNENFERQQKGGFDSFYNALQLVAPEMHLHKNGLYIPNERAHNIHLTQLKETTLYSICLNISIIAPFYTLYVLETNIAHLLKKPIDFLNAPQLNTFRNKQKEIEYQPTLDKIAQLTAQTFSAKLFPEELLEIVIPDINHDMIAMGKFTMFNAFFLDQYNLRT